MQQRRRNGLAITAGAVAAVVWQTTAEIRSRMENAGSVPPEWLPSGSSFPLVTLVALVPDGALWLVGVVLSLALMGLGVGVGVRHLTRLRFDGVRTFLAIWMLVLLTAVLTSVLTAPIVASYGGGGGMVSSSVYRGAYWGLLVGWVVAAVVALGARRART